MSLVFVVNSGSSSIKYQLVDPGTEEVVVGGIIERIGEPGQVPDHAAGMREVLERIGPGREIAAVGHRVVHGGFRFTEATLITDEVEEAIDELSALEHLPHPRGIVGNLPGFADELDDAADDDLFGARVDELVLDG